MIDDDQYFSVSRMAAEGIQAGDRCYFYYKPMVDRWKADPRWTTAHEIYKEVIDGRYHGSPSDDEVARELAWQCLFYFHVLPYELENKKLNGDI